MGRGRAARQCLPSSFPRFPPHGFPLLPFNRHHSAFSIPHCLTKHTTISRLFWLYLLMIFRIY